MTPVYIAAYKGHADAIAVLKAAGANMDTPMPTGETPVFVAALKGHVSAIAALKAAGANMDTPVNGMTPVYAAASKGHADAITALKRWRKYGYAEANGCNTRLDRCCTGTCRGNNCT